MKGIHLHSTMVLFKFSQATVDITNSAIYIPLWSYSNGIAVFGKLRGTIFTFHYGPIQMKYLDYKMNY